MRVSYIGELGFELHMPMASLRQIYDLLLYHGSEFGITDFGSYALNAMRIEKGYHGWGSEIGPEYSMADAGLVHFIARIKAGFIGHDAVLKQLDEPPALRYVGLRVDCEDAEPLPGSPIVVSGDVVGYVTSASAAHRIGGCMALGYLNAPVEGASPFELAVLGEFFPARLCNLPIYDPDNAKMRG